MWGADIGSVQQPHYCTLARVCYSLCYIPPAVAEGFEANVGSFPRTVALPIVRLHVQAVYLACTG